MKKILMVLVGALLSTVLTAQLSGIKTIPGSYPTIAAAVNTLNNQGVGAGGVTFNIAAGYTESSSDSICLTASGTVANKIIFQKTGTGVNPVLTRTGPGTLATTVAGAGGDAVFILESSDYVTIDGLDINTSNAGIEYGYYLRKASATNGCRNDTITNCAVTLTKGASECVIGMLSSNNSRGQSLSSNAGLVLTAESGRNENNAFTNNLVQNVAIGIMIRGYNAPAPYNLYDQNCIVGAPARGNTIRNFGGHVASPSAAISIDYLNGATVQYNNIDNIASGGTSSNSDLYGIRRSPTGTPATITINNNNIYLTGSTPSAGNIVSGIYNRASSGNTAIKNNYIQLNNTGIGLGDHYYIYNNWGQTDAAVQISNNTFVGSIINARAVYLIENSGASINDYDISGNTTEGTLQTPGSVYCYNDGFTNDFGTNRIYNNNFSNINLTGTTGVSFTGIQDLTNSTHTQNVYNNIISNIRGTHTGATNGIVTGIGTRKSIYRNQIFGISAAGQVTGIDAFANQAVDSFNVYNNIITDLTTNTTGLHKITGISIGGSANVFNNLVGDIKAPSASSADLSVIGISANSSTGPVNIYYNTISLNAVSSGTNFSSVAVLQPNNAIGVNLRNNILVNTSASRGSGLTVCFRRYTSTLGSYSITSNNNLFFAGVPSPNNLLYFDGTNADQTLSTLKARVAPRESNSVTENPPFITRVGNSSSFLHINPLVATQANNGGVPIPGYTTDYDGDPRNGNMPDIGADEIQSALPVMYTSLQAETNKLGNRLNWSTITEFNNRGFNIERSADGVNFNSIAFIRSKANDGSSTSLTNYTFDDFQPLKGTNYYRFQQVDKDDRFTLSNVVVIKTAGEQHLVIGSVFPVPAQANLNILLNSPSNEVVSITIFNAHGRMVSVSKTAVIEGENKLSMYVGNLTPGNYFIKAVSATNQSTPVLGFVKR